MVERPSTAFALLLVAGMLILFFGILVSGFVAAFTIQVETVSLMFLDALICGIIVLTAGILLYALPKYHVVWGVLGVIFSLFSILSLGGLFVGMILGIIGGAMGIAWKPAPPQIPTPPVPPTPAPQPPSVIREREVVTREVVMIPCAYCGNLMPQTSTFCPNCGAKRKI